MHSASLCPDRPRCSRRRSTNATSRWTKRDEQMNKVVAHLAEQTVTLRAISEATGRIDVNVNVIKAKEE